MTKAFDAVLRQKVADALGYTCKLEDIENPELDIDPVCTLIIAERRAALPAKSPDWFGEYYARLDRDDMWSIIRAQILGMESDDKG